MQAKDDSEMYDPVGDSPLKCEKKELVTKGSNKNLMLDSGQRKTSHLGVYQLTPGPMAQSKPQHLRYVTPHPGVKNSILNDPYSSQQINPHFASLKRY